jgi:hypothetical protein
MQNVAYRWTHLILINVNLVQQDATIQDVYFNITTSGEAHGWQHHIDENWHNRATTSGGEYSITTEDGRVRPIHVLIEFKK